MHRSRSTTPTTDRGQPTRPSDTSCPEGLRVPLQRRPSGFFMVCMLRRYDGSTSLRRVVGPVAKAVWS